MDLFLALIFQLFQKKLAMHSVPHTVRRHPHGHWQFFALGSAKKKAKPGRHGQASSNFGPKNFCCIIAGFWGFFSFSIFLAPCSTQRRAQFQLQGHIQLDPNWTVIN